MGAENQSEKEEKLETKTGAEAESGAETQEQKSNLDDLFKADEAGTEETSTEEKATEEAEKTEEKGAEKPLDDITKLKGDVAEMRKMLLSSHRQNQKLQEELADTKKKLTEGGTLPESDPKQEEALKEQSARRLDELEGFLETMRLSNKYGDIDAVVTQARADDIITSMAREYAAKENLSMAQALDAVSNWVWHQHKNAYRYLYETIKSKHPDFAKKDDAGKTKEERAAPGSISKVGGGGQSKVGNGGTWTKQMILDLPEDELEKVPADVYEKFMANELE